MSRLLIRWIAQSKHFDKISRHPNIELTKAGFELFFELFEESHAFRRIRHIDEHANQFVAIGLTFVAPEPANDLSFS